MAHRLSLEARAELDAIWSYIAEEGGSIGIADRLIDTLTKRFLLLAANPYMGRRRDDDLALGIRSFPVGEYLIFYRVQQSDVLILHVVSGSRNIHALFGWFDT